MKHQQILGTGAIFYIILLTVLIGIGNTRSR